MIGYITGILFLLIPGFFVFLYHRIFPTEYAAEKLPVAVALSSAWWIISFWWTSVFPVSYGLLITGTLVLSCIILYRKRKRYKPPSRKQARHTILSNAGILLFFLALFIPLGFAFIPHNAPGGQDASMHAYYAAIIARTDGFPETLRPVLPVDTFGIYPVGFSVITAGLMLMRPMPVYTAMSIMAIITCWLYSASLFTLLRQRHPVGVSMTGAILLTWGSSSVFHIAGWGAIPTILSFDFLLLAAAYLLKALRQREYISGSALFWIVAFLTHYMIPVALVYMAIPVIPLYIRTIRDIAAVRIIRRLFVVSAASIPAALYIALHPPRISPSVFAYVRQLQVADLAPWIPDGVTAVTGVFSAAVLYCIRTFSPGIVSLFLVSLVILAITRRKTALITAITAGAVILLVMNSRYFFLPFSSLLYPDRIILGLSIPLAFAITGGLAEIIRVLYTSMIIPNTRNRYILTAAVILIVMYFSAPSARITYRWLATDQSRSVVTDNDIKALTWLARHTQSSDVIMNNYTDAGVWIPAIAGRPVTTPHTNPFDMDRIAAESSAPAYAYRGEKTLTRNGIDSVDAYIREHPSEVVYRDGNVRIYRLLPEE